MPAKLSPPVCSPTGEADKNTETGFIRFSPNCHYIKPWMAKDNISIYMYSEGKFLKIHNFKGIIRKFLKNASGSYQRLKASPHMLI
jgi:hypothetical protein